MISNPSNFTVQTTPGVCLKANEHRVKTVFSNAGATTIFLSLGAPQLSVTKGIILPPGSVLIDEPDSGRNLFRGDWYCISAAGGETLLIDEVIA